MKYLKLVKGSILSNSSFETSHRVIAEYKEQERVNRNFKHKKERF